MNNNINTDDDETRMESKEPCMDSAFKHVCTYVSAFSYKVIVAKERLASILP